MKILTLNVHAWLEENQDEKIDTLVKTILEEKYTVIALQEVNQAKQATIINPLSERQLSIVRKDNYATILVDKLREQNQDFTCIWTKTHTAYDIFDEGIAILTTAEIHDSMEFLTSKPIYTEADIYRRKAIGIKIKSQSDYLWVFSVHFSWWYREGVFFFKDEAKQLLATFQEYLPFEKIIMMGDFNNSANIKDEGYCYIKNHGWYDFYQLAEQTSGNSTIEAGIAGWDGSRHSARIDYIMSNFEFKVASVETIFDGINRPIISDHYGVAAILKK